jgi:hypothetical protein
MAIRFVICPGTRSLQVNRLENLPRRLPKSQNGDNSEAVQHAHFGSLEVLVFDNNDWNTLGASY